MKTNPGEILQQLCRIAGTSNPSDLPAAVQQLQQRLLECRSQNNRPSGQFVAPQFEDDSDSDDFEEAWTHGLANGKLPRRL